MADIIYGVKTNDVYHYIGKTKKSVNASGNFNRSKIPILYSKDDIRNIFDKNSNVSIVPILNVDITDKWYDKKLSEIVEKYSDNNPLLNARWMLEGKRGVWSDTNGYWYGKTRDANTLNKLSMSKYRKCIQYDINGNYVKTWNSVKDVAINIFKDYKIANGSACSALYHILASVNIMTRFRYGSYWFRSSELLESFGSIPKRLNIENIIKSQKGIRKEIRKAKHLTYIPRLVRSIYTVNQYSDDNSTIINSFDSTYTASEILGLTVKQIRNICAGTGKATINLKYGEKTLQPIHKK